MDPIYLLLAYCYLLCWGSISWYWCLGMLLHLRSGGFVVGGL
jgi:hypothetical protein